MTSLNFSCPVCGGSRWGTVDTFAEDLERMCNGSLYTGRGYTSCGFRWPIKDDYKYLGVDQIVTYSNITVDGFYGIRFEVSSDGFSIYVADDLVFVAGSCPNKDLQHLQTNLMIALEKVRQRLIYNKKSKKLEIMAQIEMLQNELEKLND